MKALPKILLPFLLILLVGTASPAFAKEDERLAEAERLIEIQKFEEARGLLNAIIQDDSKEPKAYFLLGLSYIRSSELLEEPQAVQTQLAAARAAFNSGIEAKKKFAYNYAGMANFFARMGQGDKTLEFANQAVELEPDDVELLVLASEALAIVGTDASRERATFLLTKAQTNSSLSDAKQAEVAVALGRLWHLQGVADLPEANYLRAIGLDAENVEAYYYLGEYYLTVKKYNEGVSALKRAIELDSDYAPAYQQLAETYFLAQQFDIAKDYYKQYVDRRGDDVFARYRYAQFLFLANDFEEAYTEITNVLQDTTTTVLYRLEAYSAFELGKFSEARSAIDRFFNEREEQYRIARDYEYRGKIAFQEQDYQASEDDIYKAFSMDSSRTDLLGWMVTQYSELKRFDDAIRIQETITGIDPGVQNYYALGKLYMRVKNWEKADSALALADEARPELLAIVIERARANDYLDPPQGETQKKTGLAKPYYDQILELAKEDPSRYGPLMAEAYFYNAYYYYTIALNIEDTKRQELIEAYKKAYKYCLLAMEINPNFGNVKPLSTHLHDKVFPAFQVEAPTLAEAKELDS